ncbi:MAG: hypothetical protein U1E73_00480 [Planctomycetota bacterium]
MLLKRIEGKTLPEALARVRTECGDDALVVETRQARSGYVVVAMKRETALPRDQAGRPAAPTAATLSKWTRGFRPLAEKAIDFGLSDALLGAVERALLGTRVDLSRPGDPALPAIATRVLGGLVRTTAAIDGPAGDGPRVLALVGPTGVGKTTTLAKLAARAKSRGERIAIVTIDTFRVAAVEQLRAFAEMLDVPFTVAFTPSDLRRAVHQHRDCDRILVDTTGRSPHDTDALPQLEATLQAAAAGAVLCLAAGTRARDAAIVLDAFDRLPIEGVCVTKWDETVVPGEAVAAVAERGLPLSHLCIGQDVPADIVGADGAAIAAAAFDLEAVEAGA